MYDMSLLLYGIYVSLHLDFSIKNEYEKPMQKANAMRVSSVFQSIKSVFYITGLSIG